MTAVPRDPESEAARRLRDALGLGPEVTAVTVRFGGTGPPTVVVESVLQDDRLGAVLRAFRLCRLQAAGPPAGPMIPAWPG